jgi:predicted permease
MSNLKLAFRLLFRTPFVTTVAIVSLALGIGANAAIFSVFNAYLLRALPVFEPERLVNLSSPGPKQGSTSCGQAGGCDYVFSYAMFKDLEQQQTAFTGIAAHRSFGANLAYRGQTASGDGLLVSGSYFGVLGVAPALGRLIGPGDAATPGQSSVAVLSHAYWRDRFEASSAVLNDTIIVNGQPLTIVGVAPAGFSGTTLGAQPRIYVPMTIRALMEPLFSSPLDRRTAYWAYLFARLKPGVTIAQARTSINQPYKTVINNVEAPLQKGMSEATMARFRARELVLEPGRQGQSTSISDGFMPLTVLLSVTGIVLLSACANIANLLLVRATKRSGEMAVRLSIGASRRHLVAQLLTESMLLALMGGLAGLLVAKGTLRLIGSLLPDEGAATIPSQLDGSVLLFMSVVTIGTGLLFGLFPALHASRPDLASTMKGQSGQPSGARSAKWFRYSLATSQIVLSMLLLGLGGLFTKSLVNVSRLDLGFKVDNVLTFGLSPSLNGMKSEQSRALFERVEDELAAQPGVTSVSAAMVPLLGGSDWGTNVSVQGFKSGPDTDSNSRFNEVGAGFFRTMGVPLLAGREFTRADALGAPKVAIVNEQFAKKFNLGRDAVGKRMEIGNAGKLDIEIVGLVQDSKYNNVKDPVPPLHFLPYRQDAQIGFITFYARTALDPELTVKTIPGLISRLDPNLPVENLRTLPQQVKQNVYLDRFVTTLSAAFAGLATLLAAIGLYGVLAYTVAQRTREFGLRLALGADPSRLRGMVLRQITWMIVVGSVIGLGAAVGIGMLAQSLLFQIKGYDPWVLGATGVLLTAIAFAAGYIPARRASRVDPMRALRYE